MKPIGMLALSAILLFGPSARADDTLPKRFPAFGVLKSAKTNVVKARLNAYLKQAGKTDRATRNAFQAIWAAEELSLTDKVGDSIALAHPVAAKLLAEARDPSQPAPQQVPQILKDETLPVFVRANLALAYGKALSNRRVFEEALAALEVASPEQMVEPAAYLFHQAVAQHGMLMKQKALASIKRLLDDVADTPDRYRMVAALMVLDMQSWKDTDLAAVGRLMNNIERRLDLARGGPQTQELQRQVVLRLDELIRHLEEPPDGPSPPDGPTIPIQPKKPQDKSIGGIDGGPGEIDPRNLKELAEQWGKLPERERVRAMTELTRGMPAGYRKQVEAYFRKVAGAGR